MKRRLKQILSIALVLVMASAIAVPTVLYLRSEGEAKLSQKLQVLQQDFVRQYGLEGVIISVMPPQVEYIVVWDEATEEGTVRHISRYVDGLFVEYGQYNLLEEE